MREFSLQSILIDEKYFMHLVHKAIKHFYSRHSNFPPFYFPKRFFCFVAPSNALFRGSGDIFFAIPECLRRIVDGVRRLTLYLSIHSIQYMIYNEIT